MPILRFDRGKRANRLLIWDFTGGIKMITRYAESLAEIYQCLHEISDRMDIKGRKRPLLWFRGHAFASYNLDPNIFRKADYKYNKSTKTYSNNHLREDYRFQSFMARNFDNIDYKIPQYVIEWQEVMQHFFTKTRLMDWSESLTVALEFALESFITPVEDREISERRQKAEPVIWILQPDMLNEKVYESFSENRGLIYKALRQERLHNTEDICKFAEDIMKELQDEKEEGTYYDIKIDDDQNLNRIIGLSALEVARAAYKGREMEALKSFEINPFFYLLLRYYSDGLPVELGELPPLAVIHPYHSQRIKMQKGVFTIFPYYIPDEKMEKIKDKTEAYPSFGMEYMKQCIPYLYKIQIVNPVKVAEELIMTGAKRGNLYPDMQNISLDIENVV